MSAVQNGRLPGTHLRPVPGTSQDLRADVVDQTTAMREAFAVTFGKPLQLTDGYRDFDAQVRVKARKGKFAATPGTSVHGWGLAGDWGSGVEIDGSAEFEWMKANAPRFGWTHPLWAEDRNPANGQQEPWHWEATPVPAASYTITEEDELMSAKDDILAALWQIRDDYLLVRGESYGWPEAVNNKVDALEKKVGGVAQAVLDVQIPGVDGEAGTLGARLAWVDKRIRDQSATIAGLTAALAAVATAQGLDPDAVRAAAEKGARDALADLAVRVDH